MTSRQFLLLLISFFVLSALPGRAAVEPKTVKLLTIGNSFSANATRHLGALATARGHTLIHTPLVIGGASFQVHVEKAQLHEKNPTDPKGLYTNKLGLQEALASKSWDYVTIQQASIKSHDYSTYQPYATWLRDCVAKHAPTAKLLIHQTWEYRKDDPRFTKPADKPGEPKTQEEMYQMLTASYTKLSMEFKAPLIPTGNAFHAANSDPTWGYKPDDTFDFKAAKYPALPNQTHSINMGWQWKKQKDGKYTLGMDGHHANMAGEYLGACVWYEVLFGESAVGNSYMPKGVPADYARFLQETAHNAVQQQQQKDAS